MLAHLWQFQLVVQVEVRGARSLPLGEVARVGGGRSGRRRRVVNQKKQSTKNEQSSFLDNHVEKEPSQSYEVKAMTCCMMC